MTNQPNEPAAYIIMATDSQGDEYLAGATRETEAARRFAEQRNGNVIPVVPKARERLTKGTTMSNEKRFVDVEFPSEHPVKTVADHEILMSFRRDDDAYAFTEWWHETGAFIFREYVEQRKKRLGLR